MNGFHDDRASGCAGALRARNRVGSARTARDADEDFLRLPDQLWSAAKYECLPCLHGAAWSAARAESRRRRDGGESRVGAPMPYKSGLAVRPKKLFLSRPAEGVSDFPIRSAARRARRG